MLYKQAHKDEASFFQPCTDTARGIIQFPGRWQKTVTCRWRRTGRLPRGSHYVHRIHDPRLLRRRFAEKIRSGRTNGGSESGGVLCVLFLRPDCSSFRETLFLPREGCRGISASFVVCPMPVVLCLIWFRGVSVRCAIKVDGWDCKSGAAGVVKPLQPSGSWMSTELNIRTFWIVCFLVINETVLSFIFTWWSIVIRNLNDL